MTWTRGDGRFRNRQSKLCEIPERRSLWWDSRILFIWGSIAQLNSDAKPFSSAARRRVSYSDADRSSVQSESGQNEREFGLQQRRGVALKTTQLSSAGSTPSGKATARH